MDNPYESHNLSHQDILIVFDDEDSDENEINSDEDHEDDVLSNTSSSDDSIIDLSSQMTEIQQSSLVDQSEGFSPTVLDISAEVTDLQNSLDELNVTFTSDSEVPTKNIKVIKKHWKPVDNEGDIILSQLFDGNPNIFGVPVAIPLGNEKIQKLFMRTGFVSAKKFQEIEKKVDVVDNFDEEFDCENLLNEVSKIEKIDNSIGALTRSLSSSKLLEKVSSSSNGRKSGVNISQSFEDVIHDFSVELEDEPEMMKCTDALETSFMQHPEVDEIIEYDDDDDEMNSTFIIGTQDLERSFINAPEVATQKEPQKRFQAPEPTYKTEFMGFKSAATGKLCTLNDKSSITKLQKKFEREDEKIRYNLKDKNFNDDDIGIEASTSAFVNKKSGPLRNLPTKSLFDNNDENCMGETESLEQNFIAASEFETQNMLKVQRCSNIPQTSTSRNRSSNLMTIQEESVKDIAEFNGLQNNDFDFDDDLDDFITNRTPTAPTKFEGFKFGNSKKLVETSKNFIENAKASFDKFDENFGRCGNVLENIDQNADFGTPKFGGFMTGKGTKINIQNKSNLRQNQEKFAQFDQQILRDVEKEICDDDIFNIEPPKVVPEFKGFQFASGKTVETGQNTLKKHEDLFRDLDHKFAEEIKNEEFSFKTPVTAKEYFHSRSRFSSTGTPGTSKFIEGKSLNSFSSAKNGLSKLNKKSLFRNIKECENENENDMNEFINLPLPSKVDSHKSSDVIDTPRVKRIRLDFNNTPTTSSSSPFLMRSFEKGIAFHSTSTPVVSRRGVEKTNDASSHLQIDSLLNDSSVTVENFAISPAKRDKMVKTKLEEKFRDNDFVMSDDEENCSFSAINEIELLESRKIPPSLREQRQAALKNQLKEIEEKPDYDRKAMTGSVFMKKCDRNRMKLKDYVKVDQPKKLKHHRITFNDAIEYKFTMANYPEFESTLNKTETSIADNAKLILSNLNQVGIDEISSAFLASPGVDPSLVNRVWIENAYKFLILKFADLENSFEIFDKFEVLSPENVLLQLKYRYDREIDRSQRSAIKKCVEKDDVVNRRLILRVEAIHENTKNTAELTLSDGWYSIRATIDSCLDIAIQRGKIAIGTKLITSGAALISIENGFDPLELPSDVRLKVHANSTRRVAWHEKLGFCKNPYPFGVTVDSIKEAGGVIGCLRISVVHVYDVMYADFSCEQKEFISERVFHRIQQKQNITNRTLYEKIAHQKENEELKISKERVKNDKLNQKKLKDCSPNEIYDLIMARGNDDIINELSNEMKIKLEDFKSDQKLKFNDDVMKALGEQTKNYSRILKFRIVDAIQPGKTALVSWRSPNDDVIDSIKVGKQFEMFNSHPTMLRDEIQLTANTSTVLRPLKTTEKDFSRYIRQLTEISNITGNFDPPNSEFDCVCVIVKIESEDPTQKLQKVLVSDENFNFLYVNFWSGLNNYAMSNVVTVGKCVFMKNLQWRKNHPNSSKFLQAFMRLETSNVVENPKEAVVLMKLENLRNSIGDSKVFIEKCDLILDGVDIDTVKRNVLEISTKSSDNSNTSETVTSTSLPFGFKTPSTSTKRRLGLNRTTGPNLRSGTKRTRSEHENFSLTSKKRK